MPTVGELIRCGPDRRAVLKVTLEDGTELPPKSIGCPKATTREEFRAEILRKIRSREINSVRGQELLRARLRLKFPLVVFG